MPDSNHGQPTQPTKFVSPCAPPEGFEREVLTILIEECAEVIQRATKALRFGQDEVQPGQPWSNNCRTSQEIGDLYATINLATRHGIVSPGCIADAMERKARKLAIYMQTETPDVKDA